MGFGRGGIGHGFVVRVQVRVIVDFQERGGEGGGYLGTLSVGCGLWEEEQGEKRVRGRRRDTFWRIASSIGVWVAIAESSLSCVDWRAKASTDLRSIKTDSLPLHSLVVSFPTI